MSVRRLPLFAATLLACAVTGCISSQRNGFESSRSATIANDSSQVDRVWEAAREALRRHRFRLDRVDRRGGIITTMPETSQSLVEFWRHDVDTWADLLEATLNPVRRWVEVTLTRGDDDTSVELAVSVHKERLSSPDRQFNSTGAAYQYFGGNLPSTSGAVNVTPEDDRWLDLGRDPAMEARLLDAILERAGLATKPDGPARPN